MSVVCQHDLLCSVSCVCLEIYFSSLVDEPFQ